MTFDAVKTSASLFLFLFVGLTQPLGAQRPIKHFLRGIVVHDVSNTPISKASVAIIGVESTTTSDAGLFTLDITSVYRPGADLKIVINHADYEMNDRQTYRISSTGLDNDAKFTLSYSNKIGIIGTVQDAKTRAFIKGIRLSPSSGKLLNGIIISPVETNDFGEFRIYISKSALNGPMEYMDLLISDPLNRYKDFKKTVNILSPVEILLDKNLKSNVVHLQIRGDTTIELACSPGDLVHIRASGSILVGAFTGNSGPNGIESGPLGLTMTHYNIVPEYKHAALMLALPGDAKWRYCGSEAKVIIPTTGAPTKADLVKIHFQINDNMQSDNSGYYEVEVTVD